jgi:hypothetical protein
MNIGWKEIKEKYPKAWGIFKKILDDKLMGLKYDNDDDLIKRRIPHFIKLCYCDLEKFFDNNGIMILIGHYLTYYVEIKRIEKYGFLTIYNGGSYNSRQEAKEQAINKAFEILEGKLNDN